MRQLLFLFGLCGCLVQLNAQVTVFFSKPGGFYAENDTLSIRVEGDERQTCQIRYTLNGSLPTVGSFLYEHPLPLDQRLYSRSCIYKIPNTIEEYRTPLPEDVERIVVVRAAAFDQQGRRCSSVATASYVLPFSSGRTIALPIVSLCVDSMDLFDHKQGVFIPGDSYDPARPYVTGNYYFSGQAHEKGGYVEFIEGHEIEAQECGVRTHGDIGRRYAQKGLSLYARKKYGKKKFSAFFDDPDLRCKHLVLRPFACAWTPAGFQDHWCQQLAKSFSSFSSLASRPVVLFLNGEYWGIYFLEEKPDEHFVQDHFGIDDKQVRLVRDWAGHNKNLDFDSAFVALMDWLQHANLADDRQYQQLCRWVDVPSFTDYVLFETYIGNRDWPSNNMRCWSALGSPWRFVFFDGDAVRNGEYEAVAQALYSGDSLTWPTSAEATLLLRRLLDNHAYRVYLVNRMREMAKELAFTRHSSLRRQFDRMVVTLKPEIASQCARFGFPKSDRRWQHAVKHQKKFWKHRSRTFQKEWIKAINKRYGEHFPVRRFPWIIVIPLALLAIMAGVAIPRLRCARRAA